MQNWGARIFSTRHLGMRVYTWIVMIYMIRDNDHGFRIVNLLASYSTFLLEKPTGSQLVQKFPAFYGNRRFITALTSTRHLSPS
jgi:hypothetical protein